MKSLPCAFPFAVLAAMLLVAQSKPVVEAQKPRPVSGAPIPAAKQAVNP
jgi:hypothetical protein